jgi:hypothetical protein
MSDLIDKLLLSNPAHHYRTAPSSDGHSAAPPPNQHPGTSLPTSGSGFDLLFPDLPPRSTHSMIGKSSGGCLHHHRPPRMSMASTQLPRCQELTLTLTLARMATTAKATTEAGC